MKPSTASHPAVRYDSLEPVEGPLSLLENERPRILHQVVDRTLQDLSKSDADFLLLEALYLEKARIRKSPNGIFTRKRNKEDRVLFSQIQKAYLDRKNPVDRQELLRVLSDHYAEEIGGHFNPKVYRFATKVVPFLFSWLLNAASLRQFNPWKMTESVSSRLTIQGEIPHVAKLQKKGTLLMVPTHQSNLDSVLIGYVIALCGLPPFCYGAGLNLFMNPLLSFFMSNLGAYTVDRRKSNNVYKHTLKNYSTQILKEGMHSIFFPGGGRSRSGAIETKLKLGLLGTALEAQIENIKAGKENPNVYVVPMVTSYDFVLEASSLIEDFLIHEGKHRFFMLDDESWQSKKVAQFFWNLFAAQTGITVKIGKPMDVFGNLVDEDGNSIGPNGTRIDPVQWLTSEGEVKSVPQRDQEYTRELGRKIVDRYYKDNIVLTSHFVTFAFFEALRKKYPDYDLYRFLRLSSSQRTLPWDVFIKEADEILQNLRQLELKGEIGLTPKLRARKVEECVRDGIEKVGTYHEAEVVKQVDDTVTTEDMSLLYYYRNRLSGYGLSFLAQQGHLRQRGEQDEKGFLA